VKVWNTSNTVNSKHCEAECLEFKSKDHPISVLLCVVSGLINQEKYDAESSNSVHKLSTAIVTSITILRSGQGHWAS